MIAFCSCRISCCDPIEAHHGGKSGTRLRYPIGLTRPFRQDLWVGRMDVLLSLQGDILCHPGLRNEVGSALPETYGMSLGR